jgi:hypothetical protein
MRGSTNTAAALLLAAALSVGLTGAALGSDGPVLVAPKRVVPGSRVMVAISGFPAGSAVRIQMAVAHNPPANCCASVPYPRIGWRGLVVPANGRLRIRWRVPTTYHQCIDVQCDRHPPPNNIRRYRPGQRVEILVSNSASDFASVYATIVHGHAR